jgi:cyclopropane-fatty-acyl-phospholipid synthase
MMYSCALFDRPDETLADAQQRKIERIIDLAGITKEHHVLEIGCGWGGFAIAAAQATGCQVTGLTISQAQYEFARQRVIDEKLEERVNILLCDYRDAEGQYDRIVSIEMLDGVGHEFFGTFFEACDRLLNRGGRVVLQSITIPDQRYELYRRSPDWIQKYIFPGGELPSLTELCSAMTRSSSLTVDQLESIGFHYAETLRRWRISFKNQLEAVSRMGYDERFQRKWLYYLSSCEAAFQKRYLYDIQMVLRRPME